MDHPPHSPAHGTTRIPARFCVHCFFFLLHNKNKSLIARVSLPPHETPQRESAKFKRIKYRVADAITGIKSHGDKVSHGERLTLVFLRLRAGWRNRGAGCRCNSALKRKKKGKWKKTRAAIHIRCMCIRFSRGPPPTRPRLTVKDNVRRRFRKISSLKWRGQSARAFARRRRAPVYVCASRGEDFYFENVVSAP